jgi:ABC-type multidrug transport system fused ATPase/permease subunit
MLVLITAVLSILAIVALSPQAKHADALLVLVLFMRANGKISGILVIYQQMISTLTSYNKIRVYERELLSAAAVNKGELRYDGPCKDRDRVENVLSLSGVDVVLDGSKILKNCNITAKSNEIIALVGPSGAGKTTIVDSILRLNPLSAGTIAINNQDIESYRLDSWRQAISYVPQDPAIIAGTIAENIAFFQSQVSEEQIVYAAKCAGAHRFIESLPMSYQTQVGEGGTRLSGGQKQRVAIARAILTNPILLILDEATSALDQVSEREVMSALYELKGTIVIMIAHRLNTVRHADRIYVIDKGEVVENGSWEELVREKGVFNDLLSAPKE